MSGFLENLPTEDRMAGTFDFPDEKVLQVEGDKWTMSFDGTSNQKGFRVGILLVPSERAHTFIFIKLDFEDINNLEEYETYIIRLQATVEIGMKNIQVYEDSNLIINQIS